MSELVLVHDYLLVLRGAERTFAAIADTWPGAPISTLLYDEAGTEGRFAGRRISTSPLQRLGIDQGNFRAALPLFPTAVRRLPVGEASCVVSSSSAFAHGVRKPPGARHVCYCHSPFRYAWHAQDFALAETPRPARPALRLILRRQRRFDRRAAQQVDQYVANGRITQERIRRFWGRDSVVVHPPVDVDRFSAGEPGDYVLFVGELVRPSARTSRSSPRPRPGARSVVGAGPELRRLQARYGSEAEFLGRVGDGELGDLYAGAAALVVPGVEEFGIATVEVQAAGRPVVAIDAGGARETVVHGRTGLLVADGDRGGLAQALRGDLTRFDSEDIRAHAQRFSRSAFQDRIRAIVESE